MINVPLVWDAPYIGLQGRVIAAGECPHSKIRLASASITMCTPQDHRPLLLLGVEKADVAAPSTPCHPIVPSLYASHCFS